MATKAQSPVKPKKPAGKTAATGKGKQSKFNAFHQRLGTLTYHQAVQLLGDEGARLVQQDERTFEIQSDRDVFLGGDLVRVRVIDPQLESGLAMPPDESVPLENLTAEELRQRAIAERSARADEETMRVRSLDKDKPWTDYVVTSERSGRSYRVAIRGMDDADCFCTCPDYRTNRLGTCKHILNVQAKIQKRFSVAKLRAPYRRKRLSLGLYYGSYDGQIPRGLVFHLPAKPTGKMTEIVSGGVDHPITDAADAMNRLQALEAAGIDVTIFPDAEAFIQRSLTQARLRAQSFAICRRSKM